MDKAELPDDVKAAEAALLANTARADAQRFVVLMLTRAASEHLKMADELRDAAARVRL